jgi:hypothetical protein
MKAIAAEIAEKTRYRAMTLFSPSCSANGCGGVMIQRFTAAGWS